MGSFHDFLTVSNSIEIGTLRAQQQMQFRMAEYNERVAAIAKRTGIAPLGFFAFEKANPTPAKSSVWRALLVGAVCAVGAVAFSATVPIIVGAVVLGLGIGFILPEPETSRMSRALDRYEGYIAQAEIAANEPSVARVLQNTPTQVRRADHSASLLAERENAALDKASKGI